jgi:hypothetical protein
MKYDQQTILLTLLFLTAMWLLFFRKTEKYCGGCGAAMMA